MEKDFESEKNTKACRKAVQTRRIIVAAMVIFAAAPLLLALISGSLRF